MAKYNQLTTLPFKGIKTDMFSAIYSMASNPPLGADITARLQMLAVALVHSRLDYGNSVLFGLPAYLLRQLQSVLNAAARLVYHLKARDHITCLLYTSDAADE